MKPFALLLYMAVYLPGIAVSQKNGSVAYVKVNQFKIANLTLGSSLIIAEKTFGKPDSIESVPSKIDSLDESIYYFSGVTALVTGDKISRLECSIPKYKTPQGLKVGDTLERLFKVLGKSEIWRFEDHREVQYLLWPPCDTYMIFEINGGKISKITLDFVP